MTKSPNMLENTFDDDIEDTPPNKSTIKKGKSLVVKKNKNGLFSGKINNNSSLSFSQSNKSLNQKINKEKTIKKRQLQLQEEVNDVKIILTCPNDINNNLNEKVSKVPDTMENWRLSNIPNKPSNNLAEMIEKNKTINLTNDLTNNLNQIQDTQYNKDSILPLIKTMSIMMNKNKLIVESTVKIEFLASYNNINKIAKGKYINNKRIQKATEKFINYFVNSIAKKKGKLSDKKKEYESVSNNSNMSYNPFNSEESIIKRKRSNSPHTRKMFSDNKLKKYKFKRKISYHNSVKNGQCA